MNNNELYHHGVKGMRWGVRKKDKTKGWSKDAKEAEDLKKKKVKQMSNDDINKLTRRQELEQRHKKFNPGAIAKGLLIAGAVAAALGTINNLYRNSKETMKIGKEISSTHAAKKLNTTKSKQVGKNVVNNLKPTKVSGVKVKKRHAEKIVDTYKNVKVSKITTPTITKHAKAWDIISRVRL